MAHLFTLHEVTDNYIKIQKKTQEIDIVVELSTEYRPELHPETTSDFLDHAVETLAWGACMSIGVYVTMGKWRSTHTLCEDVAITIGAGLKRLYYDRLEKTGVNIIGRGDATLDEAVSSVIVGVEGYVRFLRRVFPGDACDMSSRSDSRTRPASLLGDRLPCTRRGAARGDGSESVETGKQQSVLW